MALNATVLAALIRAKLDSLSDAQAANGQGVCQAIAEAVVQHIQTAGVVAVVTTCPAGAGTGAGTVT